MRLRLLLREFSGRKGQPTAMILDSRTLQSTPESGARAGYDGAKRRQGSKVHAAVDTLGHLLALHVTPADEQYRAQVDALEFWKARLINLDIKIELEEERFGDRVLGFSDPDGMRLEIIAHSDCGNAPQGGEWNAPNAPTVEFVALPVVINETMFSKREGIFVYGLYPR
jgi:hypothetical protein